MLLRRRRKAALLLHPNEGTAARPRPPWRRTSCCAPRASRRAAAGARARGGQGSDVCTRARATRSFTHTATVAAASARTCSPARRPRRAVPRLLLRADGGGGGLAPLRIRGYERRAIVRVVHPRKLVDAGAHVVQQVGGILRGQRGADAILSRGHGAHAARRGGGTRASWARASPRCAPRGSRRLASASARSTLCRTSPTPRSCRPQPDAAEAVKWRPPPPPRCCCRLLSCARSPERRREEAALAAEAAATSRSSGVGPRPPSRPRRGAAAGRFSALEEEGRKSRHPRAARGARRAAAEAGRARGRAWCHRLASAVAQRRAPAQRRRRRRGEPRQIQMRAWLANVTASWQCGSASPPVARVGRGSDACCARRAARAAGGGGTVSAARGRAETPQRCARADACAGGAAP